MVTNDGTITSDGDGVDVYVRSPRSAMATWRPGNTNAVGRGITLAGVDTSGSTSLPMNLRRHQRICRRNEALSFWRS